MKSYYLENSHLRIWLVLTAMCLGIFTAAFNTTAVMNAIIAMKIALHFTPLSLQWVINGYLLACASFIIIGGQMSDMFGRRRLFIIGASLFVISSLIIAISFNPTMVLMGRAFQGLGVAILLPGSLALIKAGFPENLLPFGVGAWAASAGLGFAFGPIISGVLTTYFNWRGIFWLNIPLMLFAITICRLFTRPSQGVKENASVDLIGLFLLTCGLIPFTLGLVEGNCWGWTSPATLGLLLGGVVILFIFWIVERKIESPLVHFHHFQERIFVGGNVGIGFSSFILLGNLYFFNLFVQNPVLFHYSAIQAGMALLPMSLAMFATSFAAPFITGHFGFRLPMVIGFIFLAIACWLLQHLTLSSTYANIGFPLILFGMGMGICFSSSPALGMSALPKEKAGEGAGVINTINYYSGVLCITLGTAIQNFSDKTTDHSIENLRETILKNFSIIMFMCTVIAILGIISMWFLARPSKKK